MAIKFTQYMRPNGKPVPVTINRPDFIEQKAQKIIEHGYRFECEELRTGQVSLTIHNIKHEQDVAIVICNNGPDVPQKVDELITRFDLSKHL